MLKIRLIEDFPTFRRLAPFWNRLLGESDLDIPFMTFEWFTMLWQDYCRGNRLQVFVFTQDSEPVAVVPLMLARRRWRGLPVTQLSFIANHGSGRTGLFDVSGENVFDLALRFLWRRGTGFDMMYFDFIDSESRSCWYIRDSIGKNGLGFREMPGELSPYLRIQQDWPAYLQTRSANFREKLRRTEKSLERDKDFRIERYYAPKDVPTAMEKVFRISRNSWKARHGTALCSTLQRVRFYGGLAELAAAKGWLKILLLRHKENPVAFTYELRYKDTDFFLQTGFDEAYAAKSPGIFILSRSIKEAFADGYKEYDLLGRNEEYKMRFTSLARQHAKFWVFNRGVSGRFLYFLESKLVKAVKLALRRPSLELKGQPLPGEPVPREKTRREKIAARRVGV